MSTRDRDEQLRMRPLEGTAGLIIPPSFVFLQQSRLGRHTGRCLVLTNPPAAARAAAAGDTPAAAAEAAAAAAAGDEGLVSRLLAALPAGIELRELDTHDTKRSIEESKLCCAPFLTSQYLSSSVSSASFPQQQQQQQQQQQHQQQQQQRILCLRIFTDSPFPCSVWRRRGTSRLRGETVTLEPLPTHWRKKDVRDFLERQFGVKLGLEDIVFSFDRHGQQQPVCFCCCSSEKDAVLLLQQLQEFAVPNHPLYPDLFGHSALFVTHEDLDYLPVMQMGALRLLFFCFSVFTSGWAGDLTETEFLSLLRQLRIFPSSVFRFQQKGAEETGFFLQFDRMKDVKIVISRLQLLKRRWKVSPNTVFFALPRRVDLHFEDDVIYADEDEAADSDLDEPIDY
ncbi:hypothetical protein Emed_005891 [Eimeria media]